MVFIPLQVQEHERDEESEYLRHGDGPPDAVHTQQQGENEDGGGLEYQRAQEMAAEIAPLFNAVKKPETKMLKPASRKDQENRRKAWDVNSKSPAS